ncbi:polyprenyl synthetase family protein [Chloroflexota bacterium]
MLYELQSEIRNAVESYCDEPALREGMLQELSSPGFALHPDARCTAGLVTLKVYEAIYGSLATAAFQAAVAVELYMEAGILFDDIADDELDSAQGMSTAEGLTVAVGLMACGGRAACEAGQQVGSDAKGLGLLIQLQRDCLIGCSGQLMDARLQKRVGISTDEALEMTCRKSGSLGRSASALGAIMATEDSETIDLFREFGFNLFSYLQLIDDLRDACPADGNMRDLEQHKKTLPIAYFYNYLMQEYTGPDGAIIPWEYDNWANQDIRREYSSSGADMFCAIVAETFLNRAKSILVTLKGKVRTVEGLEHFVSSMEISPDEVFAVAQVA